MQPDDARSAIAGAVRAEMARQSRTQRQLAAALGIDQPSISLRLRGERPFRAEELVAIAAFLGVAAGSFMPVETTASAK